MELNQDQSLRMTRRRFLRIVGSLMASSAVLGAGGWTYITRIEPEWIDIVPQELHLPRLSTAFDGFRLVQISDIHLSEALNGEQLAQACQQVIAQKPDLVAITGDFIEERRGQRRRLAGLIDGLRELTQQAQVVFVFGNHDYWTGADRLRSALAELDMQELRNDVLTLEKDGQKLHVAGVDDIWEGRPNLSAVLAKLPDDGAAVLMAHEPDYANTSAKTGRFDLQLSGHSHGGQVVLPLVGPPILPSMGELYPSGLYQVGTMKQYTNRGLGTTSPHVRFNCRPEITVFTLRAEDNGETAT